MKQQDPFFSFHLFISIKFGKWEHKSMSTYFNQPGGWEILHVPKIWYTEI